MKIKKICVAVVGMLTFFVIASVFLQIEDATVTIEYSVKYSNSDYIQTFYSKELEKFTDANSSGRKNVTADEEVFIYDNVAENYLYRVDFGDLKNDIDINNFMLKSSFLKVPIEEADIVASEYIDSISYEENGIIIKAAGIDSQIVVDLTSKIDLLEKKMDSASQLFDIISVLFALLGGVFFYLLYEKVKVLVLWFVNILKSTSLICGLAFNDFKMKYASSCLGTVWAFVQPIVIVTIYVIVFGYGFKSAPVSDVPFALWLTAGIVPWFFFQDAWTGATNSLFEYSYLVKKVVFKVSVLPIVKMISAMFVHVFFIVLTIVLYIAFGYPIKITIIQTLYYTFCVLVLTLGLSYITSACVAFFKDVSQVVMIILQFGMWITPIMWSPDMFGSKIKKILMLNPMYYVVVGYRDSFYAGVWFWEKPRLTIYFWFVSLLIMIIGIRIFRRLEKHFADVL